MPTDNLSGDIRRDKLDIILRILTIGTAPVKKTHILYKAGINYYQLTRYLEWLLKAEMIEQINDSNIVYRTTQKGHLLLKLFDTEQIEASSLAA
jgi:predicted transcriptional regulator